MDTARRRAGGEERATNPRRGPPVRNRLLPLLAALVGLALLAASCGSDDGADQSVQGAGGAVATNLVDGGEPTPGGQLIIGIEAETDGWSPSDNQIANAGYLVASAIYDPLMVTTAD
ncbi:hypothetical protein B7486_62590, partial [cyanobacterium TDX16]